MAEVKSVITRTHIGLDADKVDVPGLYGERYYATDTGITYKWDGTRWRGGYEYIPRPATTHDIDQTALTTDGTWKVDGLILDGIVPVGAVAVNLGLRIIDDTAANWFQVRQNATNAGVTASVTVPAANIEDNAYAVLGIDANRLMDYAGVNDTITTIRVTVLGWFI